MKTLNLRHLRNYLPSLFFIVLFSLYAINSILLSVNIVAGILVLLILGNIFLRNKLISRTMGIIFLLGSCYMMLALLDDVFDGEATMGYLFGFFLIVFSIIMSILFIGGFKSEKAN